MQQPQQPNDFNSTFDSNIRVVESVQGANSLVEIHEYKRLRGNSASPAHLHHLQSIGVHLKRVKITLNNGEMKAESGALHYKKGNVTLDANIGGASGLAKKMLSSALTDETAVKPKYTGTGEIYLEPSYDYFMIVQLNNEEAVVDKGLYFASEGSIEVGVFRNKNVSSALFGGEGIFQTKLKGTGWVVLCVPMPPDEIHKLIINNEKLHVDGSFAILRKGNVDFTVEKSAKGFFGSKMSGEGLLQTFSGTGEVWLCPTQQAYPMPPIQHH